MNIKDLILPFILAVLTTWAIQHFFFGKKTVDQYRFTAPQSAVECTPLQKTISFGRDERKNDVLTVVETEWGICEFASQGAILNRLEFNHTVDGKAELLGTIFPSAEVTPEFQAFMVGLDADTPRSYQLVDRRDTADFSVLVFQGNSDHGTIQKTFTVHKKIKKIDLALELSPRSSKTMRARVFYPAPIMPGLKDDVVSADIIDGAESFSKISRDSLQLDQGWVKPQVFGLEDKYFIHALVKDENGFVQRAYFDTNDKKALTAIVEGPAVHERTQWNLSFYVGPKESKSIKAVDARLEQTLDYSGWLSPISKALLYLLNLLYDYCHNYGIAIIILSILIKIVLLPLAVSSERSMKGRAEMQKKLAYIQQKYKDDPQARAQAQAEFMQKHGLGLAGCLPLLLQIPIFFGLSRVLSSSIELYKAPFLWMSDLSARDPYYILPILVVIGMLSSAFNVQDTKQRLPIIAMAIAFGALSTSMAAGLVMYIAISTILNMVQTRVFTWLRLA